MSIPSLPRAARHALLALLLALAALTASALTAPARAAAADPVAITQGEGLRWGLKLSWRNYAGIGTASDGATIVGGADGYVWPFRSGSFNPDTNRAELQYGGSVRWTAHEGVLDVTVSNPRLVLDGDDAQLFGRALSKSESTGQMVDYGEIPLVTVTLREEALTVADGRTRWAALGTNLTAEGFRVFSGNYPVGTVMDPLTATYSGPGGFPAPTADNFTPAGTIGFSEVNRTTPSEPTTQHVFDLFWDAQRELMHATTDSVWGTVGARFPDTLGTIGDTGREDTTGQSFPKATFDAATATVFDSVNTTVHTYTWNAATWGYDHTSFDAGTYVYALEWDPVGRRLLVVSSSELASFTDNGDGSWRKVRYTRVGDTLPAGPRSQIAIDESGTIMLADAGQPPAEVRLAGTTATVTRLADDVHDPDAAQSTFAQPSELRAIPGGGFYLAGYRGLVQRVERAGDGSLRQVGETLRLGVASVLASAIDQSDGSFYVVAPAVRKIAVVKDGAKVGELALTQEPGVGFSGPIGIAAGADHALYVNEGGGYPALNTLAKYARGTSPTVGDDPQDAVVPFAAGVDSGTATFTAAATAVGGDPTVQWQTRAGDSGRFTDIDGATATTLRLPVTVADNGRQVRAVFSNAFGRLGSAHATVTINAAAAIVVEPADLTVDPGATAEFKVMPSGNPAPEIQWQVLSNGSWVDLADGNGYEIDGGFLRVLNASATQNGLQFRARLRNKITPGSEEWSTVFSRVATLKVASPVTSAVSFGGGHVDWGFAERWRCYVVGNVARGGIVPGAGATQVPGTLATGTLCNGRNAGSEIVRFGIRGGSFDPASGVLELKLRGTVRFWGHDYHVPGDTRPQLDTTFSNLRLVVTGDSGTLYADTVGATMDAPTPVTRTNVAIVSARLPSGPVARDGGLDWSGIETTLTAAGAEVFGSYPAGEPFDPIAISADFGTPEPDAVVDQPQPPVQQPPVQQPPVTRAPVAKAAGTIAAGAKATTVGKTGVAQVATLRCAAGARCTVTVPKRLTLKIAGKRYAATVSSPKAIAAGKRGVVTLKLSKKAAAKLAGRSVKVKLRVTVRASGARAVTKTVTVTLKGAKKQAKKALKKG
ncbi:HtaA domain-containing protein [Conexibacter sp. JD483]|uniref:HtaA domain-containing protein n=1 Tax=unclassified Conexibacter TaxID=2627773 RepID=UPI002722D0AA|nr:MULTISPECIES: HtaA domain-containing protein [unclassified Conexibacter]MDO8188570.1 HtaA domain-containing protein [Conexibacter sp. CPCC 205706]MDO8201483.1 HtaA domain-containing protein [Conexibacter sp. CPCC 205762]MDR9372258.1 HtaA domain-containing protein [Conexibacter sp. JD483]